MTTATVPWPIFVKAMEPHDRIEKLPPPPPWRLPDGETGSFGGEKDSSEEMTARQKERGRTFQADDDVIEAVNAALFLRRALLVTGPPGSGKSSLAHAVAYQLKLGRVLTWAITSRSTLADALYRYDAIGRLQKAQLRLPGDEPPPLTDFLRLGPLGTALVPTDRPRVLLVDEIDKADPDLPNDLLNVFEDGAFEIPELARHEARTLDVRLFDGERTVRVERGRIQCRAFPFVVLTSNGEREFPPAFLRRCIRIDLSEPDVDALARIVEAHLGPVGVAAAGNLIRTFLKRREMGLLATDQLLNAVQLVIGAKLDLETNFDFRDKTLFRPLAGGSDG